MKIPLFDIDGTLFKTGGQLHQDAFNNAFLTIYGVPAKQRDINPEGMTDRQVIVEVLKLRGMIPEEIRLKISEATEYMKRYFDEHKNEAKPKVLPGVKELLTKLKEEGIPMGVLTGNVEGIAWTKIQTAGLRSFFDFGAFGGQSEVRAELVEIARINAQKALDKSFQTQDFVIVGDTPKDIKCARDTGIQVIAVATGIYPFEELANEKPDLLVHSFGNLERDRVIDFLSGNRRTHERQALQTEKK
jgi:phosphoglycolate phosphatase-like HAD superfamily hydrolase